VVSQTFPRIVILKFLYNLRGSPTFYLKSELETKYCMNLGENYLKLKCRSVSPEEICASLYLDFLQSLLNALTDNEIIIIGTSIHLSVNCKCK